MLVLCSSSKRTLRAMTELDETNSPANPAEPQRKIACLMPATDTSVQVKPERTHSEFNLSEQPINRFIAPIRPPRLASISQSLLCITCVNPGSSRKLCQICFPSILSILTPSLRPGCILYSVTTHPIFLSIQTDSTTPYSIQRQHPHISY